MKKRDEIFRRQTVVKNKIAKETDTDPNDWITVTELRNIFQVSRQTIRNWERSGIIKRYGLTERTCFFYKPSILKSYVVQEENRQQERETETH